MPSRLGTIAPQIDAALKTLSAGSAREAALVAAGLAVREAGLNGELADAVDAILREEPISTTETDALMSAAEKFDDEYLRAADSELGQAEDTNAEVLALFRRARAAATIVGVLRRDTPDDIVYEAAMAVEDRDAFMNVIAARIASLQQPAERS